MLEIIGLVAGLLVGLFAPWTIPSQWSLYVAAGLLAALDSALAASGHGSRGSSTCMYSSRVR